MLSAAALEAKIGAPRPGQVGPFVDEAVQMLAGLGDVSILGRRNARKKGVGEPAHLAQLLVDP
ncbi:hypothetical protein D3C85_1729030 [compost metagenome]